MNKKWIYLALPVITLILEILPYGAVCNFGMPEGEPLRVTYSYFDLIPFGYANFGPFLTAVLTCVILCMILVYVITVKERILKTAQTWLLVCIVFSVWPLLFGIRYYSWVGLLITLCLAAELVLLRITKNVS